MARKKKEKPKFELSFKTAAQLMEERKDIKKISTGTPIDELIGGGIEQGTVIEVYGEFGAGKTQLCLSLICNIQGEVVFIDCEDTFKPERLAEIAESRGLDPKEVLSRVHLAQPLTVDDQTQVLKNLPPNLKPELIIIDGLTTLFREEYIGRETLVERQGQLRLHLRSLKNYAKTTKTVIIVTNQVYAKPDATPWTPLELLELAVGGHTLYHSIDNRIFIRKGSQGTRVAKLVDSSAHPPCERTFIISEKGVEGKLEKEKAEVEETT